MAVIDQKIDVYKWNKQHYDEESIYSTQTGAKIEGLQNFYGNGFSLAIEIELKFQIAPLSTCEVIKDANNRLSFGTVKSGNNYYWQLKYYNGSALTTYTSSFVADVDKHVFKVTKEGNYYLDSTLLVSARYSDMSTGTISIFNSGICKIFSYIGTRYNRISQSGNISVYDTTPDYYIYYYPFKNVAGTCGLKQTLSSSSTINYKWNTGTGTLSGDFNSSSLDFEVELTNENFESVKSVEAVSILGDELVYDTFDVIAKEKISSTSSVTSILFDGTQYTVFDLDTILVGTGMTWYVRFTLANLETAWQGIIGIGNNFFIAYAGNAFSHKFYVYYIDVNGNPVGNYLADIEPDNYEHTFRYENGVLTYDGDSALTGITIKSEDSATVSVGKGVLKSSTYSPSNFIGKISKVYASNRNGVLTYNASPDVHDGSYCFKSVNSGVTRYYASKSGYEFNADLDTEITFGDDLYSYPYGSMFNHYIDDVLRGKYYVEQSTRTGEKKYHFSCISAMGLLDKQYYTGNLFHGENFTLVVNEILSGAGVTFSVDSSVSSIAIYGWIPYGTKRDALRQLLFATNVHVFKDSNQNIVFAKMDMSQMLEIPSDRIFERGSIEYPKLATKISVTEHSFYALGTEVAITLYDNTQGVSVNNLLVQFSEAPIILSSFVTTGSLVINSASVNHAYVSGQGTLTGKPYTHVIQNITRADPDMHDREDYEVTVTDATLISALNSENVADRVADYYFHRSIVKADIKVLEEVCGSAYTFTNSFGEEVSGIMAKMEKVFSSFIKSSCEFVCGLSGTGGDGNNYTNFALVTSSGTWTVPAGITRIRATLIGGGYGGSSGLRGASGNGTKGGVGGAAGIPGQAGKVYIVTMDVTPGDELTITVGAGGSGGALCSSTSDVNAGGSGGSTLLEYDSSIYSSASGSSPTRGVVNIFNDDVYALPGGEGAPGGSGGNGGNGGVNSGDNGSAGESVTFEGSFKAGGNGGAYGNMNSYAGYNYFAGGGGAGGASAANAGSNGSAGSVIQSYYDQDPMLIEIHYETTGGIGGAGAAGGSRSAATVYGSGGAAGHGGGGSGGHGSGANYSYSSGSEVMIFEICYDVTAEQDIAGGNGGSGGNGAAGCVLIYY